MAGEEEVHDTITSFGQGTIDQNQHAPRQTEINPINALSEQNEHEEKSHTTGFRHGRLSTNFEENSYDHHAVLPIINAVDQVVVEERPVVEAVAEADN